MGQVMMIINLQIMQHKQLMKMQVLMMLRQADDIVPRTMVMMWKRMLMWIINRIWEGERHF